MYNYRMTAVRLRSLQAALFGAAATIALVQPQIAVALSPDEIAKLAKEFTVKIEGEKRGTGVILERDGNTYRVLTNWHVVNREGLYQIVTPDGKQHGVTYSKVRYLPGMDIAVLQFTSRESYRTAELGDSEDMTEGKAVHLVGWADPIPGIPERSYQFMEAKIVSRLQNPEKGYAIVHDNPTTPGTSGGPMLDGNGRLVGINGRFTSDGNTGRVFGLGIPMQRFLAARNGLERPSGILAPEDFVSLGKRKADDEDYWGAILDYNRALESDPDNYDAYYRRAEALLFLEDYSVAIVNFNEVLRRNPKNATVYYYRGYANAKLKNYQSAIADYSEAISINYNYADAYKNRGIAYYEQKEYARAIADYNEAIRINPNDADAYNNRGNVYNDRGEYLRAIADYTQVIRLKFKDEDAYKIWIEEDYIDRGNVYLNQKKYAIAIAFYNEAISINYNPVSAYGNRGIAYVFLKKYERAIADFNQVIRINDNSAEAYLLRGLAYQDLKKQEKAIADYNEAIRINPKFALAYSLRGFTHIFLKDYEKALADINQALRLDPKLAITYNFRGVVYYAQGDYPAALSNYNQALTLDENLWLAIANIGFIKYEMGEIQQAIQQWQAAIEKNDREQAAPQLALAVAVYAQGNIERGLAMAEAALKLDRNWGDMEHLKEYLWGEKLLADAQKLLEHPRIKAFLSQAE